MEAKMVQGLQFSTMLYCEKLGRIGQSGSLRMSGGFKEPKVFVSAKLQGPQRLLKVACSYNNVPDLKLESGSIHVLDEELDLKSKSQEIEPYLNGRCIYLVGMMGSGKTSVGKILSRVLSYSFFDSDALIEEEVDGTSVADIFKHYGEAFFVIKRSVKKRNVYSLRSPHFLTDVLRKLSMMHRHVISTGGGAVGRPMNWKYMHQGISVWLDVPVETLAHRTTAEGTNSRPLLHYEAGDAYTRTFMRLSAIFEERSEAYANANARVSLENMAVKLGQKDVSNLSKTAIAMEVLEQIKGFLKGEDGC